MIYTYYTLSHSFLETTSIIIIAIIIIIVVVMMGFHSEAVEEVLDVQYEVVAHYLLFVDFDNLTYIYCSPNP